MVTTSAGADDDDKSTARDKPITRVALKNDPPSVVGRALATLWEYRFSVLLVIMTISVAVSAVLLASAAAPHITAGGLVASVL